AHKLALPHAEVRAALANVGLKAIGHGFQPFATADAIGNGLDFSIGSIGTGIADVIGDCATEEKGGLGDDAEFTTIGFKVDSADVLTIDEDFAPLKFVETGDELGDGALASASMTDEGDTFAGF